MKKHVAISRKALGWCVVYAKPGWQGRDGLVLQLQTAPFPVAASRVAECTPVACCVQELVNVMWAIGCMEWSPPMLYWRGLLGAAHSSFSKFNPQDLANCISAGVVAVYVAR